jgi:hypothetical protein
MAYTSSFLNTSYSVVNRREAVEIARSALKRIIEDSSLRTIFENERSILNDGLNTNENYINQITNTLDTIDVSNLKGDIPENLKNLRNEEDVKEFLEGSSNAAKLINNLFSGISGTSNILTDLISLTGILPDDFKKFTSGAITVAAILGSILFPQLGIIVTTITVVGFAASIIEAIIGDEIGDALVNL